MEDTTNLAIDHVRALTASATDGDCTEIRTFCPNGGGHEHVHVLGRAGHVVLFASDQAPLIGGGVYGDREEALQQYAEVVGAAIHARDMGEMIRMLTASDDGGPGFMII